MIFSWAYMPPRVIGFPDAGNLLTGGGRGISAFYTDTSMMTLCTPGDPIAVATDVGSGLGNNMTSVTLSERPIFQTTGMDFGGGGIQRALRSAASAGTDWSAYVRCTTQTGGSGILCGRSPISGSFPVFNIYPLQSFFFCGGALVGPLADPAGDIVRMFSLTGTTLRAALGASTASYVVPAQGLADFMLGGAPNPDVYAGSIIAWAFYNVGHTPAQSAAVEAYLMSL